MGDSTMNREIGALAWIIPDGFTPPRSSGSLESHEAICIVNCTGNRASVKVTVYFEDQAPYENIGIVVEGQRTKHVRTDTLEKDGMKIPKGIPYAMKVESDIPIVVQYSRMDATQAENTLMTTMAYPV
jgi:hypothetical protein